jgi:hypothetical protein
MQVYGGSGDTAAIKMETPYGQVTNTIPSFEFMGFPMQEQRTVSGSQYTFQARQASGNAHEGDSFRGAMFFRGPQYSLQGTQSPYYEGAGPQGNHTNYTQWEMQGFSFEGQFQRQWTGRLRYTGKNTKFAAHMEATDTVQNQTVPNPQRQGHPQGQGNQGLEFLSQHPNNSQYGITITSGQYTRLGWEHEGSFNSQVQSPVNPRNIPQTALRNKGTFVRVRPRGYARQEQFTTGVALDFASVAAQGLDYQVPTANLNDKQQPAQQTYSYHNQLPRRRPVRTQRNEDSDRQRPVRVQTLSSETKRRPTTVQQLQRVSRRRPVRNQVNQANEQQRNIQQTYQYNNIVTKQRPVQQTYPYNNVETRQRPVRNQVNEDVTRQRPARVAVLQRVSRQKNLQQTYSYHNQVPRRKSVQQTYSYHNRVTRQKNLQQTYSYHNQVPRRRPVQQTYNYHNQVPRRRPVRQPFPSTRPIGPLAKVKQIWINEGGVLRKMDEVYLNDSGTLKKTHQSVPTSQLTDPNT